MGKPLTAVILATDEEPVDGRERTRRSLRREPSAPLPSAAHPLALYPLCGRPLLGWTLDVLADSPTQKTVVVTGSGGELVAKGLQDHGLDLFVEFLEQPVPRGSGGALGVALTALPADHVDGSTDADVLVLPAWLPLLSPATVANLVEAHRLSGAACTLLTTTVSDAAGQCLVSRDERGRIDQLVAPERMRDYLAAQRSIGESEDSPPPGAPTAPDAVEVFTGVLVGRAADLALALRRVSPRVFDGTYRLESAVETLSRAGLDVAGRRIDGDAHELSSAVGPARLSRINDVLHRRIIDGWIERGVRMVDPSQVHVEAAVQLGAGVELLPGTLLEGSTVIASSARIGPHTRLTDCMVGSGAVVANTVGRDAEVGPGAIVGPFADLAPGASVAAHERTGPFFAHRGSEA